MPMPKAAVNEQGDSTTHKDNIRIAGQILSMQSKSVTHSMEH